MARIAGLELPKNKRVEIGLSYIYGVGRPLALKILDAIGIQTGIFQWHLHFRVFSLCLQIHGVSGFPDKLASFILLPCDG